MSNEARVKITADTSEFQRNVVRATGALRDFSGAAAGSFTGFNIGAASIAAVGASMALIARNAINMADEIGKAAQKTGMSTEALSALRLGAQLSDVAFEDLVGSLGKLAKFMDDSTVAGSSQAQAFVRLGVAATDVNGKLRGTDAVFADIAEAFSKMPDGAQKTAIAMELFGKSGAQLIPLLNSGKDGLAAYREEAERLGLVVSAQMARDAEAFNDSLTMLGAAAQGAGLKLAGGLLPAMNKISGALAESTKAGDGFTFWGETFGTMLTGLSIAAAWFGALLRNLGIDLAAFAGMARFAIVGEFSKAAAVWEERNKDIAKSNKDFGDTFDILTGKVKVSGTETAKAVKDAALAMKEAAKVQAKALADSVNAQIADTKRLRDAVRKAAEDSLAEARKFAEEAKKLREDAAGKLTSRQEQAEEKRASALPEAEQDQRNIDQARQLSRDADLLAAKAYLDALDGRNAEAARKAEQALKLAEKAAGFADKIKDASLGANLLEGVGEIESAAVKVQAELAQKASDEATAKAQAQFKTADELSAKLAALEAQAKQIKVGLDTTQADGQLDALRTAAEKPIVIPVQVGGEAAPEIQKNARGGLIRGAGSDTSDNLLSWLSPGEYVVKAAAVRKYGPGFLSALNNMNLPAFANGGLVSQLRAPTLSAASGGGLAPAVFNFPEIGRFETQVSADTMHTLKAAFSREALRKGRR